MLATTLAVIAIVTQDQSALRAAPRESATQQAVLWQGDNLEIRGEKGDYLQVYDHRRERAGYIRASQVRVESLDPQRSGELLAVVRFLRDTPGAEALGIAYAAAYLKAAPAQAIDAEAFDALGTMAERLAHRASGRQGKRNDAALSWHLDVAAGYGVALRRFERDGRIQLCYDGEAFRRVLAVQASAGQRARAALALTRHDCVSPDLTPVETVANDQWRAEVLDRVDTRELSKVLKSRMRLRKAGVWAGIAHQQARRGAAEPGATQQAAVQAAGNRALDELAAIHKGDLSEDDATAYADAAIRVGASRWAGQSLAPASPKLKLITKPGQPGETCVRLTDARDEKKPPLATRCTYGVVWPASAAASPNGTALTLAVQPLATWREMWVFRQVGDTWSVDVLPPSTGGPDIGYVEFAGWVPGGTHLLAAREARVEGRYTRRFELVRLSDLAVEKQADQPASLSAFYRWQDPTWKQHTVSLR